MPLPLLGVYFVAPAERTKHFDVKYHYLRQKIAEGEVKLMYINTKDQLADIFTKALGPAQFQLLNTKLTGIIS